MSAHSAAQLSSDQQLSSAQLSSAAQLSSSAQISFRCASPEFVFVFLFMLVSVSLPGWSLEDDDVTLLPSWCLDAQRTPGAEARPGGQRDQFFSEQGQEGGCFSCFSCVSGPTAFGQTPRVAREGHLAEVAMTEEIRKFPYAALLRPFP